MKPITPSRILADGILIEASPLARNLANVHRGADLGPVGASRSGPSRSPYRDRAAPDPLAAAPVIVRVVGNPEDYGLVFRRMTIVRHRMSGGPAPRLLSTLGTGTTILASVEELLSGTPLAAILRAIRAGAAPMPVPVALAIGLGVIPLWSVALPDGVQVSVDTGGVILDVAGRVRVLPTYREEQSRHDVGAALFSLRELIALASPEEVMGAEPDDRSVMFYLGQLLYEMIAGVHPVPVDDKKLFEVLSEVARSDAPHLRRHRPDVHPVVADFVHRCLDRDRSRRFASWAELETAFTGVRSLFPPTGPAEILEYVRSVVPGHPLLAAPPVILPHGWEAFPDAGYRPVAIRPGEDRLVKPQRPAPRTPPSLDADLLYARGDGRPMFAVGGRFLVDARPVTRAEIERFFLATGTEPPDHLAPIGTEADDGACALVPVEVAESYAAWAGKRLPTEAEWEEALAAIGPDRLGVGGVWEWTSTPHEDGGRVIRGGRWRDQLTLPARWQNRSFATRPAPDLGFRCVSSER